jgi:hypothetical protein
MPRAHRRKRQGPQSNLPPNNFKSGTGHHAAGTPTVALVTAPHIPADCTCKWDCHNVASFGYYWTLKFRNTSCPVFMRKGHE